MEQELEVPKNTECNGNSWKIGRDLTLRIRINTTYKLAKIYVPVSCKINQ